MSEIKEIKLLSTIDNEITTIRASLAKKIKTISEMMELFSENEANEGEKDHEPVPVQVRTSTLKEVIEWCELHKEDFSNESTTNLQVTTNHQVSRPDTEFLKKYDMDTVLKITKTADYLNVTVSMFLQKKTTVFVSFVEISLEVLFFPWENRT